VDKVDLQVSTGRFPLAHNRYIHNYDICTAAGAFYFMVPALFVFLFVQSEIVREKEYKLRQGKEIVMQDSTSSEPSTRPTG
jgi:hypothetical protein